MGDLPGLWIDPAYSQSYAFSKFSFNRNFENDLHLDPDPGKHDLDALVRRQSKSAALFAIPQVGRPVLQDH